MSEQAVALEKLRPFFEAARIHPRFPRYAILPDGNIVSFVAPNLPRILTPIACGKYGGFTLSDCDRRIRRVYHHQLVAEAYHGMRPPGQEVRHLDGDRTNNAPDNLCWGTRSQNMRDKDRHGTSTIGERHPQAKLTEAAVLEMRRLKAAGVSTREIMERFGMSRMACWRALTSRSWSHIRG